MTRELLITYEMQKGLEIMSTFDSNKLTKLQSTLEKCSEMKVEAICLKIAEVLIISETRAIQLYSAICYLSDTALEREISAERILSELIAAIKSGDLEPKKKKPLWDFIQKNTKQLNCIISPHAKWRIGRKKRRLLSGINNSIEAIRTICDVRPIFDETRKTIIDEGITISLEFMVRNMTNRHEKIILTMNEESLEKLKKQITMTEQKIMAIKSRYIHKEGE